MYSGGGGVPPCSKTVPVVPLGRVDRAQRGHRCRTAGGTETLTGVVQRGLWGRRHPSNNSKKKISMMDHSFYLSLLLAFLTAFHISVLGCLDSLPC
jgi:hypothetical protein